MFTPKKVKSKNIRKKDSEGNAEHEILQEEDAEVEAVIKRDKKMKPKVAKSTALSFDNDENETSEGPVFQLQKSKASQRLSKERKLAMPENMDQATIAPQQEESSYSKERLEQLRSSTPSTPIGFRGADPEDPSFIEKFQNMSGVHLTATTIPDDAAVLAAKKHRELARQGVKVRDNEDDFIPLDTKNEGSRLVREEDEVGDAEEEYEQYVGERMVLGRRANKERKKRHRDGVAAMIEDAEEDEEMDDEMHRWQNDLMSKAMTKEMKLKAQMQSNVNMEEYHPTPIPKEITLPTLSNSIDILSRNATMLREAHIQTEKQLAQTNLDISKLSTQAKDLDIQLEKAKQRYTYFQDLKAYVSDLTEFLDAKMPALEEIESEFIKRMLIMRMEAIEERRRVWLEDDLKGFMNFENEEMATMDEFGRMIVPAESRARRKTERELSRTKRVQEGTITPDQDGLSSDDDNDSTLDEQEHRRFLLKLKQSYNVLLVDVNSNFSTLSVVKARFEIWKREFNDDYVNAFGGLSLPGAFEFYVRLELAFWDPFQPPKGIEFDEWAWHQELSSYGLRDDGMVDSDIGLLGSTVEKVVVPRITKSIASLDPFSSKKMKTAIEIVEQVGYYVNEAERPWKDLIKEFIKKFEDVLEDSLNTIKLGVSRASPLDDVAKRDRDRIFGKYLKLLKNLLKWKRYFPKETMISLVSNGVVDGILLKIISAEDTELTKNVIAILPRELMLEHHVDIAKLFSL